MTRAPKLESRDSLDISTVKEKKKKEKKSAVMVLQYMEKGVSTELAGAESRYNSDR